VPRRAIPVLIVITLTLMFNSCTCIYFNTFHNIRRDFNNAEKSRRKGGRDKAQGAEVKQYSDAITRASRVLEKHPTSSWVDDALYVIGASYYYLGSFDKSARKFKELFANFPQSKYIAPSRLMLAKSQLQLKEEAEAIVIFEQILEKESNRGMRAEASNSLGQYYFESKDYLKANYYFKMLVDSLGEEPDKLRAFSFIGDGYFEKSQYKEALINYGKALKHAPDTLQYYQLTMRMAQCNYFLDDPEGGLEKLSALTRNEIYFDSLAPIRLLMAQGYEWEGNLDAALDMYDRVAVESPGKDAAAIAYYQMALIYQYEYEDLVRARAYYDKARQEKSNSPVYGDAARRSSTLSLLEQYTENEGKELTADSVGTLDPREVDRTAENDYLLGELLYFDLEKPDSALNAFSTLLERYPHSRYAPRAMIAMAYIYRTDLSDSVSADSLLQQVMVKYPHADEVKKAIDLLGLTDSAVDTGYAAIAFNHAQKYLEEFEKLDSSQFYLNMADSSGIAAVRTLRGDEYTQKLELIDSAQHYYRQVIERFPLSEYSIQARYTLLYLYDRYLAPGDSTLIDKYAAFVDSFPQTEYADAVSTKYRIRPTAEAVKAKGKSVPAALDNLASLPDSSAMNDTTDLTDTTGTSSGELKFVSDSLGNTLEPANQYFLKTDVPFVYPLEALAYRVENKLYFQIRIDFLGEVVEVKLMNPTPSAELNTRIIETVKNSKFDSARIKSELYDRWFYYTYIVRIPDEYRQ